MRIIILLSLHLLLFQTINCEQGYSQPQSFSNSFENLVPQKTYSQNIENFNLRLNSHLNSFIKITEMDNDIKLFLEENFWLVSIFSWENAYLDSGEYKGYIENFVENIVYYLWCDEINERVSNEGAIIRNIIASDLTKLLQLIGKYD